MNEIELAIVAAVRAHPKVGLGSCSHIDECFSDAELIEQLATAEHFRAGAEFTVAEAVAFFTWSHDVVRDVEDDRDAAWRNW